MNISGEFKMNKPNFNGELTLSVFNPLCSALPYINAACYVSPDENGNGGNYHFPCVINVLSEEEKIWTGSRIMSTVENLERNHFDAASKAKRFKMSDLEYVSFLGQVRSIDQGWHSTYDFEILQEGGIYDHVCEIRIYIPHVGVSSLTGINTAAAFDENDRLYDMMMLRSRYAFQLGFSVYEEEVAPKKVNVSKDNYSEIIKGIKTQMHGEPEDDDDEEDEHNLLTKLPEQEEDEDDEVYGEDELDKELADEDDDTDFSLDP